VFVKAKKETGDHRVGDALANVISLFKCPDCGQSPLVDKKDHLECSSCNKKWEFKDGIYDFREPLT
jgi:predicted RNA-binding Zn-ribbon protein involved in translation (DUF1610 family)